MSEFKFSMEADVLAAFAGLAKTKADVKDAAFGLCVQPDGGVDLALDVGASCWAARIDSGATVAPNDATCERGQWLWVAPRVADCVRDLARFAPGGRVYFGVNYTPEMSSPGTATLVVPGASQVLALDRGVTYKAPEPVTGDATALVVAANDLMGVLARAAHCLDKHEDRGLHQARIDGGPGGATVYASNGRALAVLPLGDGGGNDWTRLVPACAIKPFVAALGDKKAGDNPVAIRARPDDTLQAQTLDGTVFEVRPGAYDDVAGATKALPGFFDRYCNDKGVYRFDLDLGKTNRMPPYPDAGRGGGCICFVLARDGEVVAFSAADLSTRVVADVGHKAGTWEMVGGGAPPERPSQGFRFWILGRPLLGQAIAALGKPKMVACVVDHNCDPLIVSTPAVGRVIVMPMCDDKSHLVSTLADVSSQMWGGEDGADNE